MFGDQNLRSYDHELNGHKAVLLDVEGLGNGMTGITSQFRLSVGQNTELDTGRAQPPACRRGNLLNTRDWARSAALYYLDPWQSKACASQILKKTHCVGTQCSACSSQKKQSAIHKSQRGWVRRIRTRIDVCNDPCSRTCSVRAPKFIAPAGRIG